MNKQQFLSIYNPISNPSIGANQAYDLISHALNNLGILTDLTLIGALATARVEVGKPFLPVAESIVSGMLHSYGKKYRGRGYIQLTWDYNYKTYGDLIGLDLINNPDLALIPENAAKILAYYFKEKGCDVACNEEDWVRVRQLVNGGANGLTTFLSIVNQYLAVGGSNNININETKNMTNAKLDIVKIEYTETQTVINWSRYNTDNKDNASLGAWTTNGELTPEECLAFAKTMIEPGMEIEVSLNLAV